MWVRNTEQSSYKEKDFYPVYYRSSKTTDTEKKIVLYH